MFVGTGTTTLLKIIWDYVSRYLALFYCFKFFCPTSYCCFPLDGLPHYLSINDPTVKSLWLIRLTPLRKWIIKGNWHFVVSCNVCIMIVPKWGFRFNTVYLRLIFALLLILQELLWWNRALNLKILVVQINCLLNICSANWRGQTFTLDQSGSSLIIDLSCPLHARVVYQWLLLLLLTKCQ